MKRFTTITLLCAAAIGWLAVGCRSTKAPPATRGAVVPWTIKITKATPSAIEVDVFGVAKSEDEDWRNAKMDEYWKANSSVRESIFQAGRAKTTRFDGTGPFVIDAKDPIWKKWKEYGSYELAVMANLPGNFASMGADPRRKFLPLGKKEWDPKTKGTIEIEILDHQIRVLTPQKP